MQPLEQQQVREETQIAQSVAVNAQALIIRDPIEYETASQALLFIQSKLKSVEAMRTRFTKPLNAVLRDLNAQFKPPKDFYTQAKVAIQRSMRGYLAEKEKEKQLALAAASAASEANNVDVFYTQAAVAHEAEVTQSAGVHTRDVWKFEVTDVTKIPVNYLIPNEVALRAFAKQTKGTVEMPGIRIYKEAQIVARTAK